MCVIVCKPRGLEIPWDVLENCFNANPHGAGFTAVSRNGTINHRKGLFSFEDFKAAFAPYNRTAALIHFRITTHGETNEEMCHPFEVLPKLHVAHNGVIPIDISDDKSRSDTWHFVQKVLKPELETDPDMLDRDSFQFLLSTSIGYSSMAFIDGAGRFTIINEETGLNGRDHWKDVWFSNSSFRKSKVDKKHRKHHPRGSDAWDDDLPSADEDDATLSLEEYFQTHGQTVDTLPAKAREVATTLQSMGYSETALLDLYAQEGLDGLTAILSYERNFGEAALEFCI